MRPLQAHCHHGLGTLYAQTGQREQSRAALSAAIAIYRAMDMTFWWPQAEALVGFLNAWQISGEEKYLGYTLDNWAFIKKHILDRQHGEWFWGVKNDYSLMPGEDKVGIWKCPYHNGRACLETIRRLQAY